MMDGSRFDEDRLRLRQYSVHKQIVDSSTRFSAVGILHIIPLGSRALVQMGPIYISLVRITVVSSVSTPYTEPGPIFYRTHLQFTTHSPQYSGVRSIVHSEYHTMYSVFHTQCKRMIGLFFS